MTQGPSFQYDVFVSYSHQDEAWVHGQLVPALRKRRLRVCIDDECFCPGHERLDEMERCVSASAKTVAVLTPAYLASNWTEFERSLRRDMDVKTGDRRLIPVLLQPCALPPDVERLVYVDFTKPGTTDPFGRLAAAIRGTPLPRAPRPSGPLFNMAPPLPSYYVPREQDLQRLRERLKAGGGVAVTAVHGMGGVGKSVLAAAQAHDAQAQQCFPDGVLWATLGPRAKGADAFLLDWGHALGVDLRQWETTQARCHELQRVLAGQRCLLVVDDVWPGESLAAAKTLWRVRGAGCCALCTTRYPDVAKSVQAEPLALGVLSEAEALALFAARWGRELNAEERALAAEVARRVGCLPLAVLLAAARGTGAAALAGLVEALRKGQPAAEDLDFSIEATRQESLRLCFDASYDYLHEDDRLRYRLLGAVPAQTVFGVEEAAVLWEQSEGRCLAALRRLVAHAVLDGVGEGRWRQHLLLRGDARARAERQKEDLRHALLRVVWAREDVWDLAGRWQERLAWLQDDVEAAHTLEDRSREGACLTHLGLVHAALGETRKAIGYYAQALGIVRELRDRHGEGVALGNLGNAYAALGETRQAIGYYEQALGMMREIGDRRSEAADLGNLGNAYAASGETNKALGYYEQALGIAREVGDRRCEGSHLGNLGLAYAALGETRQAIGYYELALEISREIGDRRSEANALCALGLANAALGQAREAVEFYEQALAIHREIGDRGGEGTDLGNLGNAYADLGETLKAIEYYEQILIIHREIGDRRGEGNDLGNLGNAYAALGETGKAIEHHEQALGIAREIGDRSAEGAVLNNLANEYREGGEMDRVRQLFEEALEIARQTGERPNQAIMLQNLSEVYEELGDTARAIACQREAVAIWEELGHQRLQEGRERLARLEGGKG